MLSWHGNKKILEIVRKLALLHFRTPLFLLMKLNQLITRNISVVVEVVNSQYLSAKNIFLYYYIKYNYILYIIFCIYRACFTDGLVRCNAIFVYFFFGSVLLHGRFVVIDWMEKPLAVIERVITLNVNNYFCIVAVGAFYSIFL